MILSLILATTVAPSPTPTPLKEITRVRASLYCTGLRQNVSVAVAGLSNNDKIIAQSRSAFEKFGGDLADGKSATARMDQVYLENLVGALTHNLQLIDRMLNDPARFPSSVKTQDERRLNDLKTRLQAVADQQRKTLNVVSGALEAQELAQTQHEVVDSEFSSGLGLDTQEAQMAAASNGPAGLRNPHDIGGDENNGIGGSLGEILRAIQYRIVQTRAGEDHVAPTIISGAQECDGVTH